MSAQKKWPRNRGHSLGGILRGEGTSVMPLRSTGAGTLRASEPEIGQVAIAHRNAGAGHQQAVDRRHQAAEQRAGGRETDGSCLGHGVPFSGCGSAPLRDLGTIYVYRIPEATALFA